jgi:predicted signal transduction protein with EAL and GGDEF domain/DNA-binding response OmpR family regulator
MGKSPAQLCDGRPTVLIVDDDVSTRLLLGEVIRRAGFRVVECSDGVEAREAFELEHPDIVMLDVQMPGEDGFEVCRKLRAIQSGWETPILMVTALDDVPSIKTAFEVGATDYVTKPVNYLQLPHRLHFLLRAAEAFRAAREGAHRLSRVQRLARLGQWELYSHANRFAWAPEAREVFGFPANQAQTVNSLTKWVHRDDRPRVEAIMKEGQPHRVDYRMVLPGIGERLVHQEAVWLDDQAGDLGPLIGIVQDITMQRETERQVTRLAYFDTLTGLPNRAYLTEFLERAVSAAHRGQHPVAVMALDLDLFKRVNDSYGHSVGDALLEQVALRIKECIRGADAFTSLPPTSRRLADSSPTVAARFGGDEFLVVLSHMRTAADAGVVAQRILGRLSRPYQIAGVELQIQASIGIATYPTGGKTAEELLRNADAAMYHAKERGRNNFQFFSQDIHDQAQRRARLESALRQALGALREAPEGDGSLSIALQPQVCSETGDVSAVELLLRWTLPEGPVSPAEFIPIAEDTGLIVPLGEWVLGQACQAALRLNGLRVAVNVSARQLRDTGFLSCVRGTLKKYECPSDLIDIEITEGVVMQNTAQSLETLAQLKAMGLRISLDDFGTGYSSLSYLTRFPIDQLKIDRSFVADIWNVSNASVVSAIIALARNLNLEVVVEGVETRGHVEFFARFGRLLLQGYYFARPQPEAGLQKWLAERQRVPAASDEVAGSIAPGA